MTFTDRDLRRLFTVLASVFVAAVTAMATDGWVSWASAFAGAGLAFGLALFVVVRWARTGGQS